MMRGYCINHRFRLMIFLTKLNTKIYVSSLNFMVNSLTDVMEKTGTLRHTHIQAELLSQKAGNLRNFYGMLQSILPERCTKLHSSQKKNQFRVNTVNAQL